MVSLDKNICSLHEGVPGVMEKEKEKEIEVVYTDELYFDVRVPLNGILYIGTKKLNGDLQNNPYMESIS